MNGKLFFLLFSLCIGARAWNITFKYFLSKDEKYNEYDHYEKHVDYYKSDLIKKIAGYTVGLSSFIGFIVFFDTIFSKSSFLELSYGLLFCLGYWCGLLLFIILKIIQQIK